jgi:type IV secretory pathway VirB10-like protein
MWEISMINSLKARELPEKKKSIVNAKTVIAVIIVISILLICWLIVHLCLRKNAPDPAKMTDEQAIKYAASTEFADLKESEKIKYMDKVRAKHGNPQGPPPQIASLSEAERQTMMKNMRPVMEKKMKEDMKKFFAMSKTEQEAELDRRIDEMEARRKNDAYGSSAGGRTRGLGGPGFDPRRMFEGGDSTMRAQMSKMMKMMRERMQAKGISGPGGGGPPP